nr:immunoglobulin heavy chain junction region [Macaca mulatta]
CTIDRGLDGFDYW